MNEQTVTFTKPDSTEGFEKERISELRQFALRIRLETMKQFKIRGFGHVGGALSIIDALAVLYGGAMNIDPAHPNWPDRDKLVCSKGHAGPALYSALALKGYFPLANLATLNRPGTCLPSHCDCNKTCGIDMTTGSLGQGFSLGVGMALGDRLRGRTATTFLIIGDGECDEGQVWEAAMFAAHRRLDNLILLLDRNGKQLDGNTADVLDLGDLAAKFAAFGWHTQSIAGNDIASIDQAIRKARQVSTGQPRVIVLNTVKGAGVASVSSMMHNHHIEVTAEFADQAIAGLEAELAREIAGNLAT